MLSPNNRKYKVTKETITKLIGDFKGNIEDLGQYIYEAIEQEKTLRSERTRIQNVLIHAQNVYDEAKQRHKREMNELYEECPHYETSWHGDPAGGSDSYTECSLCGKQW